MKDRTFILGLVLLGVLKLVFALVKKLTEVLAYIIVYFGLYFPMFYLIFGVVLINIFNVNVNGYSPELGLYFFGLALCSICSVLITLRSWGIGINVLKPFKGFKPSGYFKQKPKDGQRVPIEEESRGYNRQIERSYDEINDLSDGEYYIIKKNGVTVVEDANGNPVQQYQSNRRR